MPRSSARPSWSVGLIRKVGAATLGDPALLEPYALTEPERALLAIDPGYEGVSAFGRLDGFLSDDGSACWYVESNLESPAGIGYDEALAEIFDELEVMRAFRRSYSAEAFLVRQGLQQLLLDTYRDWGGQGTPTIAIVDFKEAVTWPEFEHLRDRLRRRHYNRDRRPGLAGVTMENICAPTSLISNLQSRSI